MRWWRWFVVTAAVLVCAAYHPGWFVFAMFLVFWAPRFVVVFDRPESLTDDDILRLLNG